jgi:LytS/YehU family sensor histidine kinase
MRGFISWYGDIKLKEDLTKKNFEMELALVKSQINPHFLFNTIHNIDILIEKDAKQASAYLNKLSDIMRFMLYETKTEKIFLARELTYIEEYISLQKIRTSNPDYVHYTVNGEAGNLLIEPMLFIPFIENAFKHSENTKSVNTITIQFDIAPGKIIFSCENHYLKHAKNNPAQSGLGNELIKKRLALLYPGSHTLEVNNANEIYKVQVTIRQNEN